MGLNAWIKRRGYGAASHLHRETGVSRPAIERARKGKASLRNALVLSAATGVPAHLMTREKVPAMGRLR